MLGVCDSDVDGVTLGVFEGVLESEIVLDAVTLTVGVLDAVEPMLRVSLGVSDGRGVVDAVFVLDTEVDPVFVVDREAEGGRDLDMDDVGDRD